jgi:hypothetical protein
VRTELFNPTPAGEARLLLLIVAFSGKTKALEGRPKLAKLDFFLRYPTFLKKALEIRDVDLVFSIPLEDEGTIESRMVRYRYGPWDPAYFALLGRLIGHGLIEPVPVQRGIGYRATSQGREIATQLASTDSWAPVAESAKLLKQHFDLSGTNLKKFIYDNFPEVSQARWGDQL